MNFCEGRGSYAMHSCVNNCCIYTVRLGPAINGSSEIQRFECSDVIKVCNGIIFDFYTGLPHVCVCVYVCVCVCVCVWGGGGGGGGISESSFSNWDCHITFCCGEASVLPQNVLPLGSTGTAVSLIRLLNTTNNGHFLKLHLNCYV